MKYINTTDEFTRGAFAIEMERSMSGDNIVTILEALLNIDGAPEFLRMDNGTEMTSKTVAYWCRFSRPEISFIDRDHPGKKRTWNPSKTKLRDELLGIEIHHATRSKNHGRGQTPGLQLQPTPSITGIQDTTTNRNEQPFWLTNRGQVMESINLHKNPADLPSPTIA